MLESCLVQVGLIKHMILEMQTFLIGLFDRRVIYGIIRMLLTQMFLMMSRLVVVSFTNEIVFVHTNHSSLSTLRVY